MSIPVVIGHQKNSDRKIILFPEKEYSRFIRFLGDEEIGDKTCVYSFKCCDLNILLHEAILPNGRRWDSVNGFNKKNLSELDMLSISMKSDSQSGSTYIEPISFKFREIAMNLTDLFDRKQHDYGSSNISDFGEFGILVRVNDKVARLKNLLKNNKAPKNEALTDSWADIATYSIIALMVRKGLWAK